MIAVTCRNGEQYSVDPGGIERIERAHSDTVIIMIDGSRYAVGTTVDDVLRQVRDHHAATLVLRKRLLGGVAEIADAGQRAALFVERRQFRRDTPDDLEN